MPARRATSAEDKPYRPSGANAAAIAAWSSSALGRATSGPSRDVPRETAGADHRQAASSVGERSPTCLPPCVLAWRRRHPAVSGATSREDPPEETSIVPD